MLVLYVVHIKLWNTVAIMVRIWLLVVARGKGLGIVMSNEKGTVSF